jgi:micrococcal nuclease
MLKKTCVAIVLLVLTLAAHAHPDDIIVGKVVSVADGDTITILENRTQHRIRLFGIDAPERHQDFGNRSKQFAADLVFDQQVRVVKQDTDRYGRIVGIVYVGGLCVNEELLKNGLAWVYRHYCKIPVCMDWLDLEMQARAGRIGLWSHSNPIPPWEFRRTRSLRSVLPDLPPTKETGDYSGNQKSKVFHQPGCKDYGCKNCVVRFSSRKAALDAGFKPCGNCRP